jgi:glyoxylase-like metal-dependent hydrolase (beta-lactamase superfamily II)
MTSSFRRWRIGSVDLVQVLDSTVTMAPREMFPDLSEAEIPELEPNADGDVELPVMVYAFTVDGQTTIVDCGVGASRPEMGEEPGVLLAGLADAGIGSEDVDRVMYTHLHPDHIGGGVDLDGSTVFPNADYVTVREEWDFWMLDVWRTPKWAGLGECFARRLDPLPATGQLQLVDVDARLSSHVTLEPLTGHTPGQVGIRVETGTTAPLLFTGDALHHLHQWRNPDLRFRDDADAPAAIRCRRHLRDGAVESGAFICAAHFPRPGNLVNAPDGPIWQQLPL